MHCSNHPGVLAIGRCVSCWAVICDGCATRVQGRNLCAPCLKLKQADEPVPSPLPHGVGTLVVASAAMLGFVVLSGAILGLGHLIWLDD